MERTKKPTTGDMSDMKHRIREQEAESRKNLAELHLAHDFGWRAKDYIFHQLGEDKACAAVLSQRVELIKADALHEVREGVSVLVGKIDLIELGLNPEQIAEVSRLKAMDAADVNTGRRFATAVGGPQRPADRGAANSAGNEGPGV